MVSYGGSPLFNLSKYIGNILKPYTLLNKQHCKNSEEFSKFILAHTIEENEVMVSSDVEALYTKVPIEDALVIIKELLENDETLSDRTPLSPKNVLDLLGFLVRTTFFIFNDILITDRRSCDGRITFINSCRNLHAGNRNDSFNNN